MAKPRVSGETKRKSRGRIGGVLVARDRLEGGRGGGEGRGGKGTVGARKVGKGREAEVATKVRDNGQAGLGQVSKDDG
ncbi:hypothetical protein CDV36_004336 [Fusarium kuroshium]|uniref:Uncharacterized protein n=2 Tax=Fusarium solani species complex TaxID=232080 RepID=A0A3M2SEI1_9HYPO|nr:hypothetical protein CDV36_004336 [Fusarium kuroshium]RSM05145.1 hypothetical protein CDV31_009705 [Fusarium ambrosium]